MAALNLPLEEKDINDFKFVRLKIPDLIPDDLIENVKGRTFTPSQFYAFQNRQIDNPNNFLFALIEEESIIQGFLWAVIEWDGTLWVNTFSISKELWGKGKAMDKVNEFLSDLMNKTGAQLVMWATTNKKFFLKKGFKESKISLMEFRKTS